MGPHPLGKWADISQAAELLRPIRLYHWREAIRHSDLAFISADLDVKASSALAAEFHMRYVQQLNEFFEPGDTAEADNK